ncbi:MAG: 23S rRNA (uracil(1939)-C(5))-methyltransferase RlmD [Erysipelotrichaceae bacterium]|nr:23S rRNA (uracil(1939)-C(5))-methyltransferase RlmD [Erysipelotrichaceae bacterium]
MEKCKIAKLCGGCQLQGQSYEQQVKDKQEYLQKLWPNQRLQPFLAMEDPYHYRHKVYAAFAMDKKKQTYSGIFQANSHKVIAKDCCDIEEMQLQQIVQTITKMMKKYRMMPYDEDKETGFLRYVYLRKGYVSQEVMVVLVVSSFVFPAKNAFIDELLEKHPCISTIVLNLNRRHTSIVLGEKEKVIYGSGHIQDTLCGCHFQISSRSFYQVNPRQTEVLYQKAIEMANLTGKETVLDTYCGIGTIGLIASKQAKEVIGVELNQEAIKDAIRNAKINHRKNIRFIAKDASVYMQEAAEHQVTFDVVFMDPPRTGSTVEFLSSLVKMAPKRVVYISCGPDTQVRDVKYLLKHGYVIQKIQGVDMFPFTRHVECVAVLSLENTIQ